MRYKIDKPCEVCGKIFQVEPHRLKHGRGRTCSQECGYILRGQSQKTKIQTTCQRCGKPFEAVPSKLKYGHGKFCSKECFNPPAYTTCLNCGKEFRYSPSHERQYCCKKCADTSPVRNQNLSDRIKLAWQDEAIRNNIMTGIVKRSDMPEWYNAPHFQKGAAHPKYKGNKQSRQDANHYVYKKWRQDVYKRDNFTCQICHKRGGTLVAHHIQRWADAPELRFEVSNGQTLCKACHDELHGLTKKP